MYGNVLHSIMMVSTMRHTEENSILVSTGNFRPSIGHVIVRERAAICIWVLACLGAFRVGLVIISFLLFP